MQDMIARAWEKTVRQKLLRFPAVVLLGPRQVGKTTLAKSLSCTYFDLESEKDKIRMELDWEKLVAGEDLVVLDEAQSSPGVFPRLRSAIDEDRKRMGRFLLLGSVAPSLMVNVSESLAGRLGRVLLTPFLMEELPLGSHRTHWLVGGYPDGGILGRAAFPEWQKEYLAMLAQRDLPEWGLTAPPSVTDRFVRMLAALHGQLWNASQIGQSLGLSHHTVNRYLDFLEGAFLVRRLTPYHGNLKKRLVKSPKVYLRDSGLLHAVLNVSGEDDLLGRPWVGASWEGYVIEQALGTLQLHDVNFDAAFFRTSDGYEIDLVIDFGQEVWAIETKLTANPAIEDIHRLNKCADMIGAKKRILVTHASESLGTGDTVACNVAGMVKLLSEHAAEPRSSRE